MTDPADQFSEMVDRVANALSAQMVKDQEETSSFYGDDYDGKYMKRLALAAIEAMCLPTRRMVDCGSGCLPARISKDNFEFTADQVWSTMVESTITDYWTAVRMRGAK